MPPLLEPSSPDVPPSVWSVCSSLYCESTSVFADPVPLWEPNPEEEVLEPLELEEPLELTLELELPLELPLELELELPLEPDWSAPLAFPTVPVAPDPMSTYLEFTRR